MEIESQSSNIILFPKYEELKSEVKELRADLSKLYFENELINVLNSKEFMNILETKKIKKEEFKEILNVEINKNKKITVEEKIRFINTYLRDKIEISDEIIVEKYNNL